MLIYVTLGNLSSFGKYTETGFYLQPEVGTVINLNFSINRMNFVLLLIEFPLFFRLSGRIHG